MKYLVLALLVIIILLLTVQFFKKEPSKIITKALMIITPLTGVLSFSIGYSNL